MKNLVVALLTLSLVSTILGLACVTHEKETAIGAVLPLTGQSALLGELARNGLTLGEEHINTNGGVNGRPVKVIFEDGLGDPNSSISAFRKLTTVNRVKFVITTHSSVGLALAPIADKEEVLLFVHASHPQITGDSRFVFRHSNIAQQESQSITDFALERSVTSLALAIMHDDYGIAFRDNLKRLLADQQIEVVSDVTYEKTEADFKTVIQKLLPERDADMVVVAGLGNGVGLLVRRLREIGFKGETLITLGAAMTGAFQGAGEAAEGIFYVDFDFETDDERFVDLSEEYFERFGKEITPTTVVFYNSLFLLAEAIGSSEGSPSAVSGFLENLQTFEGVGERLTMMNRRDIVPSLRIVRRYVHGS